MIILLDTLTLVKSLLLGGICFLVGTGLSYFLWNFALKKRRDIMLREAETEGEAQKRIRCCRQKKSFCS